MSKIGRKPIKIDGVKVEIKGHEVHYKGPKASGVYHLPLELDAQIKNTELYVLLLIAEMISTKNSCVIFIANGVFIMRCSQMN